MDNIEKNKAQEKGAYDGRNAVEQLIPDNSYESRHKEVSEEDVKKGVKILNPDCESMNSRG